MLTNNDIMKKLRVALKLRDTDIIEVLKLAEFTVTPAELSAIFRSEGQANYRPCGDQLLRRFLDGLIIKNRGKMERGSPQTSQGSSPTHKQPLRPRALPPMTRVEPLNRKHPKA